VGRGTGGGQGASKEHEILVIRGYGGGGGARRRTGGRWLRDLGGDFAQSLTLTFRARVGGPVLAQVSGDPGECGLLSYNMPGRGSVGLGGGLAANALLTEIDQLAGLRWEAALEGGPIER